MPVPVPVPTGSVQPSADGPCLLPGLGGTVGRNIGEDIGVRLEGFGSSEIVTELGEQCPPLQPEIEGVARQQKREFDCPQPSRQSSGITGGPVPHIGEDPLEYVDRLPGTEILLRQGTADESGSLLESQPLASAERIEQHAVAAWLADSDDEVPG